MPKITLKAGEERAVQTGGLFLSIIEASSKFIVTGESVGGELTGETGRQFEIPNIRQVTLINRSANTVEIEYESSNIKASNAGKGVVQVGNEVVVKRISEPMEVKANATVNDGNVTLNSTNAFASIHSSKTTVAVNSGLEIFPARAAIGRKVLLQLITNKSELGLVRIGSSELDTSANKGIVLRGNKAAVGSFEWETETSIYVFNASKNDIELAGGEMWRA